jgi:hypothetical protein
VSKETYYSYARHVVCPRLSACTSSSSPSAPISMPSSSDSTIGTSTTEGTTYDRCPSPSYTARDRGKEVRGKQVRGKEVRGKEVQPGGSLAVSPGIEGEHSRELGNILTKKERS